MPSKLTNTLTILSFLAVAAPPASAQKKHRIKPTVRLAKTWDGAVAEAKMLRVPIVVHLHGFY
jgi:hypothetical protein